MTALHRKTALLIISVLLSPANAPRRAWTAESFQIPAPCPGNDDVVLHFDPLYTFLRVMAHMQSNVCPSIVPVVKYNTKRRTFERFLGINRIA